MEIRQITEDKDNYLEMLLIADPQENMIRRYLDKSDMFVLEDAGEVLTIGVVELYGTILYGNKYGSTCSQH